MKLSKAFLSLLLIQFLSADVSLPEFKTISGTKISQKDLSGPWIVNVFFSSCGSVCPILMNNLKKISKEFPKLKIISISVDPKNDTAEALKEYRQKLNIDNDNWIFLLADLEKTKAFIGDQLKITTDKIPDLHSTRIVLLNDNQITEYFQGLDNDGIEKLRTKLKSLK